MSSPDSDQGILNDSDEIDILGLIRRLIDKRWQIIIMSFLGTLFAVIYLHMATPQYSAQLKITPASSATGGLSKKLGSLGGLATLAGASVGSLSGESATPFDLYLEELTSRELANELAKDPKIMTTIYSSQWDKVSKTWYEPKSSFSQLILVIKSIFGIQNQAWHAPNGITLQSYLAQKITIVKPGLKGPPITLVRYEHRNPKFAVYLLSKVNEIADARIRKSALAQATQYAAYLSVKMNSAIISEHRKDLSEALSEQEKSIMMASSSLPYAALVIQPPIASDQPTQPKPVMVLLLGLSAGAFLGILFALIDFKSLGQRLKSANGSVLN